MKNLVTLTLAFFLLSLSYGQFTTIGTDISTIAPVNNYCAKVMIEQRFFDKHALGMQFNVYADTTTSSGLVVEPYYRFYTGSFIDQNRFYMQLSAYAGQIKHTEVYDHEQENVLFEAYTNNMDAFTQLMFSMLDMDTHQYITKRYKQTIMGGGVSCGISHRFGNSPWSMYAQTGLKFVSYSTAIPESVTISETTFDHVGGTIFNSTPHGYTTIDKSRACSLLTGGIGFTYQF